MTEMPRIPHSVIDRLQARPPGGSAATGAQHPDANLLSAFSENLLQKRERSQLMAHLAQCPQCRDVLALQATAAAQMAGEVSPTKARRRSRAWLARTELRWAAVAASVAVVAGIVLLRQPDRLNEPKMASSSAASPPQQQAIRKQDNAAAENAGAIAEKEKPRVPVAEKQISRRAPARAAAAKAMPTTTVATANGNFDREILRTKDKAAASAPPLVEKEKNTQIVASAPDVPANADASPTLTQSPAPNVGSAGKNAIQAAEVGDRKAEAQTANPVTTSTATDSVRPQPTSETASSGTVGALIANPTMAKSSVYSTPARVRPPSERWRVQQGMLQRSEDNGQTWSAIELRPGMIAGLTTATLGDEVWAGDSQGGLSHSTDGGQHWRRVLYGGTENIAGATIVSILIPSPGHIVIRNSAGHTWTTSDNGKTWRMQ